MLKKRWATGRKRGRTLGAALNNLTGDETDRSFSRSGGVMSMPPNTASGKVEGQESLTLLFTSDREKVGR